MFGQFFNILYNIVDRIFIGRIPKTGGIALASIGVCAPALTALTAFAFMVGIGGTSYMSISLGQKDRRRESRPGAGRSSDSQKDEIKNKMMKEMVSK